jgi:hypothetical protein
MKAPGVFDPDTQMFREGEREPNVGTLRFLRWLAEQEKLEHKVFGPSVGEYSQPADEEPTPAPQ